MSEPMRIQLSRRKGFRLQQVSLALNGLPAVKVDRSTRWGNDFTVEDFGSAAAAVNMFEHDLAKCEVFHPDQFAEYLAPLRNRNLGCWCRLCPTHAAGKPFDVECSACAPCHADVLGCAALTTGNFVCAPTKAGEAG